MYERVRRAWATIVGVEDLQDLQVVSRPTSAFAPPGCAAFLRIEDTLTVTCHDDHVAGTVRAAVEGLTVREALDLDVLRPRLPPIVDVLGPTSLFYLPAPLGAPAGDVDVVDRDAVEALVRSVSDGDLDESGMPLVTSGFSVARDGDEVVAACGYIHWPAELGHLCILTHPDHRDRGHATRVGAHAAARAEAEGLIPQWRARVPASQAVARAIGFAEVGNQLRLRFD